MKTRPLLFSTSLLVGALLVPLCSSFARTDANAPAADNSSVNQRDRGHQTVTPIDQSNKPADIEITREIRRSLVNDNRFSTYARNIKIITVDGAVTLRGPVSTEQEKAEIAARAAQFAGYSNVHNQLEVAFE